MDEPGEVAEVVRALRASASCVWAAPVSMWAFRGLPPFVRVGERRGPAWFRRTFGSLAIDRACRIPASQIAQTSAQTVHLNRDDDRYLLLRHGGCTLTL